MVSTLQKFGAWVAYRLLRAYWWIRRPVILGVRVLIATGDRVLLVKHSYRDGWFLPGGTPKSGEPLDVTACREAQEETGIAVSDVMLLGIYSSLHGRVSDHVAVFAVEIQDTEGDECYQIIEGSSVSQEVEDVQWVPVKHPSLKVSDQTRSILRDWRHAIICNYRVVDKNRNPGTCT